MRPHGQFIARCRIQQEHWDNSSALEEARVYGIPPFEVGMRDYIKYVVEACLGLPRSRR